MNRGYFWALLVLAGMAIGYSLGSYDSTNCVLAPSSAYAMAREQDLADEVKEIKTDVKKINTLLQSGKLRVIVSIYPESNVP